MRPMVTLAVLAAAVGAGCASGPMEPTPCVRQPGEASSVTVSRVGSVVGAPATMFVVVERERVYALQMGQSFSFLLDPGDYGIGYDLGFNECRKRLFVDPNRTYRVDMAPGCNIDIKDLSDPCRRQGF